MFPIDERATRRKVNLKAKTSKNKPNFSKKKVGGLGHHVREYGMIPRRYILGSWPNLYIKLINHKDENRDIMTFTLGIIGGGRAQCVRTTLPLNPCLCLNTIHSQGIGVYAR